MGKFRQFLTSVICPHPSVLSFPDHNLSKCQWIFTKLGIYIDIVYILFGIANGQILSIFDRVTCHHKIVVGYYRLTFYLMLSSHWYA